MTKEQKKEAILILMNKLRKYLDKIKTKIVKNILENL